MSITVGFVVGQRYRAASENAGDCALAAISKGQEYERCRMAGRDSY